MPRLLRMPEVAANMRTAVLASWPVADNVAFFSKDVIATVETDKAVVDVEAEQDGVIVCRLVSEGSEVAVGEAIALLANADETVVNVDTALVTLGAARQAAKPPAADFGDVKDAAALDIPEADPEPATPSPPITTPPIPTRDTPEPNRLPAAQDLMTTTNRVFASPLARKIAREANLGLAELSGTGPDNRIVRRDVELAITRRQIPPASIAHEFIDHPHSRQRRMIAERLVASKHDAPHFYLRATANAGKITKLRRQLNEARGQRVSLNDFILKAAGLAFSQVPAMNVIWTPEAVRQFQTVDISLAIATSGGLVTPVLRSIETLSVTEIATRVQDFQERSKSGRLQQSELMGGCATVTNLGMFGVEEFAAIINPPQACILAVGAVHPEPCIRKGKVAVAPVLRLTLSVDHRPIDGAIAAGWMHALVRLIENPVGVLS